MSEPGVSSRGLSGAVRGGIVGAFLASVLILLPAATRLDAYEISDQLVFMGLPLLAGATAVGAFVGAALRVTRRRPPQEGGTAGPSVPPGVFIAAGVAIIVAWLLVLAKTTGFIALGG